MNITADSGITYDSVSLLADGKRFFPMMGEMHFSRYPREYWEEELCKMKAGGIDIVSLYVIWIHHEEIQGEFDFTGNKCLRDFIDTVKKCGLYCILRIGPWAHGEVRNGGFPDWLLEDAREHGYETRTDAPRYLEFARTFYEKTYEQVKGSFIKDGGPIIGIQIENEYGHCGGKNGEEGEQHMRTLLAMAKEIGFETPLYTATGWGGAVTGGMLPVMGGYCEAPWDQRTTEIEPSGNYIFTRERNDHNIGSDHGIGAGITFDMNKFPYLTAELGGGLQVTRHRRPIATGLDTAAMTMVKLGSGANLLGYYMYHGGTNPHGKLTTLQETKETGYPNDLPEYSYDFNAPLREFGQMEDTYREVRLLSAFIHDFGDDLCDMLYIEQPGNPLKPENSSDLRTAVRYRKADNTGYLFVNNYQRRYKQAAHKDVVLKAYAEDESTIIAEYAKRDIEDGDFFFYPFNMPIGSARVTVDATPMCIVHDFDGSGHDAYVFYTDKDREISADVSGDLDGNIIITLTREEALLGSKVVIGGREHLIISDADAVTAADGAVELYMTVEGSGNIKRPGFRIFPELENTPQGFEIKKSRGKTETFAEGDVLAIYEAQTPMENTVTTDMKDKGSEGKNRKFGIAVSGIDSSMSEVFIAIDYEGNTAKLLIDGKTEDDNFYTGQKWEIGLKRFRKGNDFKADIEIEPLYDSDKEAIYLQTWPKMEEGMACRLNSVETIAQYHIKI